VLVTGDRIGDALLKWPAIVGLKSRLPRCHLTWIAGRRASVFCGPFSNLARGTIDETKDLASIGVSWKELLRSAPSLNADIVISTEPKLRNAILDKRIPCKRFISPAAGYMFSDRKPSANESAPSSVVERLKLLFELAIQDTIVLEHHVAVEEVLLNQAQEILGRSSNLIGFSPGAGGISKRWPLDRFIAVAAAQESKGRVAAFFLGPDEEFMLSEIRGSLPQAVFPEYDHNFQRLGGPMLSIALATLMNVSVANDAGGGHLLAAGGKPLVSLYGHTSAEKFRPRYGPHRSISALDFGAKTMNSIPVNSVIEAVDQMYSA